MTIAISASRAEASFQMPSTTQNAHLHARQVSFDLMQRIADSAPSRHARLASTQGGVLTVLTTHVCHARLVLPDTVYLVHAEPHQTLSAPSALIPSSRTVCMTRIATWSAETDTSCPMASANYAPCQHPAVILGTNGRRPARHMTSGACNATQSYTTGAG